MTDAKLNEIRAIVYNRALNHIDDYFEYRYESNNDKQFVMEVLANVTKELRLAMKEVE